MWNLAEEYEPMEIPYLCNFHAWALARSGKAEAVTATFLKMLDVSFSKPEKKVCDLCRQVAEQEVVHLRDLVKQLERNMFLQWMKNYGSLCLDHAKKLQGYVPLKQRRLIKEIIQRNREELRHELEGFREHVKQGTHSGGGLLGRAAEFLVGQRGL
jgi:hypothetical protein